MKKTWNIKTQNDKGLPRPIAHFGEKFETKDGKQYLYAESPIPFQTSATPDDDFPIDLIQENEDRVFSEGLCGYCGVAFEANDIVIRWTTGEETLKDRMPIKVLSDHHPFHLECMRETRIYCPHMRETLDTEFETGPYAELRSNAERIFAMVKQ